jgi:hypothetical protein
MLGSVCGVPSRRVSRHTGMDVTQALEEDTTRKGKRKLGVATREITIKRRRAAGAKAMPSTPNTRAKKRKPLRILRPKRVRGSD